MQDVRVRVSPSAPSKLTVMQINFVVDGRQVAYTRDNFTGTAQILTPDGPFEIDNALNPLTHFSLKLVKNSVCRVYNSEVRIEKTRPLLFAGFRSSKYRIFVNNVLVAEAEG